MAYTALYRKYRPSTFCEVVGQEHITETLKHQLDSGKLFHAYLFTGTRGTGKTSCAKILSKAVNCLNLVDGEPCGKCEACRLIANDEAVDIVEIDAASNNGVDNIRELRDRVAFTPVNMKYKVYIIDEVHMLSIGAFNALLKTLEEPPKHIIFILATTEIHKLPATIISRCQRFDFKRIEADKLVGRIKYIAEKEDFTITDDAAELIAALSDGGMRDCLSLLDLCASATKNITSADVENVCGMAGNEHLFALADCIKKQDAEQALLIIDSLYSGSVDMMRLLSDLIGHYRNLMIVKAVKGEKKPIVCSPEHLKKLEQQAECYDISDIMSVLKLLDETVSSMQNGSGRCEMEIAVIKLCTPSLLGDVNSLEKRIAALEKGLVKAPSSYENTSAQTIDAEPVIRKKQQNEPENTNTEIIADKISDEPVKRTKNEVAANDSETDGIGAVPASTWQAVIGEVSKSTPLISGMLSQSKAYIKNEILYIDTENPQFIDLMNSDNKLYREKLHSAMRTVFGRDYRVGRYKKEIMGEQKRDLLADLQNKLKELEVPRKG